MKHKLFSRGLLMASLLLATSCSDFLTEDPKGKLTPDNFYSNQDEVELAVYALYSKVQAYQANSNPLIPMCQGDDVTSTTGSNKAAYLSADAFETPTDQKGLEWSWKRMYHIIFVANDIIKNVEKADIPEAVRNEALGQAHYWRAFSYFTLVRLFGPLPMPLENAGSTDMSNMQLTSVEDIYTQIVKDLTTAEGFNLPTQYTGSPKSIENQNVYISAQTVKATLAAVYMSMAGYPMNQTNYYTKAAEKAKEVMDGVKAGTYKQELLQDWNQIFSYGNNHHAETLLGIDFNTTVGGWGDGDSQFASCHQLGSLKGWGDFLPERRYWKNYPDGPRKDAMFAKQLLKQVEKEVNGKKETQNILVDWWATTDGKKYNGENAVVSDYRPMYVSFTVNDGPAAAPYDYTKPFWGGMCINKRHQLIRYSEVLLWYAESAARSGAADLTEAKNALKEVRKRAYADQAKVNEVDGMSADQLAEAAYTEHGYEVAGYMYAMVTRRADQFRMNRLKENYDYRTGAQNEVLVPKGTLTHSLDKDGKAFTYTLAEDVVLKENMEITAPWNNESSIYHNYPPRKWKRIRT